MNLYSKHECMNLYSKHECMNLFKHECINRFKHECMSLFKYGCINLFINLHDSYIVSPVRDALGSWVHLGSTGVKAAVLAMHSGLAAVLSLQDSDVITVVASQGGAVILADDIGLDNWKKRQRSV